MFCFLELSLLAFVLASAQLGTSSQEIGGNCTIPNESTKGICIAPMGCLAFQNITFGLQLGETGRFSFVRALECSTEHKTMICCPQAGRSYVKPELSFDGMRRDRNELESRSGGSEESALVNSEVKLKKHIEEIDKFPWAALLFYQRNYRGCGGVLISRMFVLTAAHCLAGNSYEKVGPLQYVRLGEFDVNTDPDEVHEFPNITYKNERPIDVRPRSIKVHPDYVPDSTQKHHDIGLIKLVQEVIFTDFISPICLPESRFDAGLQKGQRFVVCGWGKAFFNNYGFLSSPIKMCADPSYVESQDCEDIYRAQQLTLGPGQFCAGGKDGQDACSGDSGSPLMFADGQMRSWVLSGIVSRGPIICGEDNKPGIYTNVKYYLPWIKANVQL